MPNAASQRPRAALAFVGTGLPLPAPIAGYSNLLARSLSRLRHSPSNPSELFQMQEVMPGIESNHMLDALLATFCVHADALEVFDGRASQQSQIRPAKRAEILKRLIGVGFVVPKPVAPQVLVVASQLRAVMRQHHAKPITPDEL